MSPHALAPTRTRICPRTRHRTRMTRARTTYTRATYTTHTHTTHTSLPR